MQTHVMSASYPLGLAQGNSRENTLSICVKMRNLLHAGNRLARRNTEVDIVFPDGDLVELSAFSLIQAHAHALSSRGTPVRLIRAGIAAKPIFEHKRVEPNLKQLELEASRPSSHWGTSVNGSNLVRLMRQLSGRTSGVVARRLYDGVSEAMTNTKQHAWNVPQYFFSDDVLFQSGPFWWICARDTSSFVEIVICDLGVGIPQSFRNHYQQHGSEHIRKIFDDRPRIFDEGEDLRDSVERLLRGETLSDCFCIDLARHLGNTSTELSYRGKGLSEVISLAKLLPGTQVTIHSNCGLVKYEASGDGAVKRVFSEYQNLSVKGTVISWLIPTNKRSTEA